MKTCSVVKNHTLLSSVIKANQLITATKLKKKKIASRSSKVREKQPSQIILRGLVLFKYQNPFEAFFFFLSPGKFSDS